MEPIYGEIYLRIIVYESTYRLHVVGIIFAIVEELNLNFFFIYTY